MPLTPFGRVREHSMYTNSFHVITVAWIVAAGVVQYLDKPNAWLWVTLATVSTLMSFLIGVTRQ